MQHQPSIDDNKKIYYHAFGLGDKENNESWTWFMRRLEKPINDMNELVFVSDCHKSIASSISLVFLDNFHALYIDHLRLNLMTNFNNDNVCANFMVAAKACQGLYFSCHAPSYNNPDPCIVRCEGNSSNPNAFKRNITMLGFTLNLQP